MFRMLLSDLAVDVDEAIKCATARIVTTIDSTLHQFISWVINQQGVRTAVVHVGFIDVTGS